MIHDNDAQQIILKFSVDMLEASVSQDGPGCHPRLNTRQVRSCSSQPVSNDSPRHERFPDQDALLPGSLSFLTGIQPCHLQLQKQSFQQNTKISKFYFEKELSRAQTDYKSKPTLSIFKFQQLTIEEGTAAYNAFLETPIPVLTKFYFFDMLNPRDLFHNHEKPILEERGPYTFR